MTWIELAPTVSAAFLASLVECVEAATIVLAVGTVRGWKSAFVGTGLALAALATAGAGVAALRRRLAAPLRHALAAQGDPARRRHHPAA
jgi:hypothetical protein